MNNNPLLMQEGKNRGQDLGEDMQSLSQAKGKCYKPEMQFPYSKSKELLMKATNRDLKTGILDVA